MLAWGIAPGIDWCESQALKARVSAAPEKDRDRARRKRF
jgi:hypothetical protein